MFWIIRDPPIGYGTKPRKIFIFQLIQMPGNNISSMFRSLTTLTAYGTRNEWMTITFVKNYSFRKENNFEKFQQLVLGRIDISEKICMSIFKIINYYFRAKYSLNICEAPRTVIIGAKIKFHRQTYSLPSNNGNCSGKK